MNTNTLTKRRVTIYFRGELMGNIHKVEASAYSVTTRKYAQYSNAVEILWIPKGGRNVRGIVQAYRPDVLVLEGWGHPDPDSLFGEEKLSDSGAMVSQGRHASCSDGWAHDFAAKIDPYIAAGSGKVLADFRGHQVV